jgi:hypothetical protein
MFGQVYESRVALSRLSEGDRSVIFLGKRDRLHEIFNVFDNYHLVDYKSYSEWFCNDIPISNFPMNSDSFMHYSAVLSHFKQCTPLFSRHYKEIYFFDLELRSICLQTLAIYEKLEKFTPFLAHMGTSGSHHLPTMMFEAACRLLKMPQVFDVPLYDGYALPMIQINSAYDRKPINSRPFEVLDDSSRLHSLNVNFKAELSWVSYKTSFVFGVFTYIKHHAKKLLRLKFDSLKKGFESRLTSLDFRAELEVLVSHLRAVHYFNRSQRQHVSVIDSILNSPNRVPALPLIVAHYQPESSTFPEGGRFHNHIDIVSELRLRGITGPILYKEHPMTFSVVQDGRVTRIGVARSKNYYQTLTNLGCLFVSESFNIVDNHSIWPITITGSIALERSVRGLATVVLGHAWYRGLPGEIMLEDFVKKFLGNKIVPQHNSIEFFDFLNDVLNGRIFSLKPLLWSLKDKVEDVDIGQWNRQFIQHIIELLREDEYFNKTTKE